ncbi:kinase-like protein [Amniculicola lignicola CBS 123094]|uniref:Kinase-like protein n=1 Tax=Amniculicola lignicola CBS 123094 TaxID=1392246 RepID=A0A6A5W681_9PLEO|nr:kinase-like protein [Amniculicola lignicola CBS 123094]
MSSVFKLGQVIKGKLGEYIISKQIKDTVWFAKLSQEQVVIKSVFNHPRVQHERDILRRFQERTPYLRSMIDEIQDPAEPVTIVLKYLDDNLHNASNRQTLNRREVQYVSKRLLQALSVLHEDGFVHTDVKLDNVLVNYGDSNTAIRFTDIQLADCGATYRVDSEIAKSCTTVGAPIWRSPEIVMGLPVGWNTATDIWSYGLCLIALMYGGDFHVLRPPRGITVDHEDYDFHIMIQQFKFFGPLSNNFDELLQGNENNIMMARWLVENVPKEEWSLFSRVSETELPSRDRDFICRIMKMDPRDRPTAKELLKDSWFDESTLG